MALGSHLITVRRLKKYIDDVIGKKANLPDTSKTIIGNISQIKSDVSNKQDKTDNALTTTDKTIIGAIDEVNEKADNITHGTCANLLNPTAPTRTTNGVTFTNNGDGTYTVNGTASSLTYFPLADQFTDLDLSREYKIVGCPQGDGKDNYVLYDDKNLTYKDTGNGVVYTPTNQPKLYIRIVGNTTCNNLLFKPMLTTDLNAKYSDYVPYTGDSGRLNEDVAEINNRLAISMKDIYSNVNIAPQEFTQVRILHGLDNSKITGITPYFNGNAMGGVTSCHLDGNYVVMNISNYSQNQTISGVAGANIYYHN